MGNMKDYLDYKASKGKTYEEQYMEIVEDIMSFNIVEGNSRTEKKTARLPHQRIQVNLSKEFPILKSKNVKFDKAVDEIMWIMQRQSNNIKDLNSHIWDEWADPETGEIGAAYGSIVKQYHQIDNLIQKIKNDPSDRGMIISLWDLSQLHLMRLRPCCLMSEWSVIDGYLNCELTQRSGDMMLGVAFNTTQYAALLSVIAQVTGTKPGLLTHNIMDAHIYDDQFENTYKQMRRWRLLSRLKNGEVFVLRPEDAEAFGLKEIPSAEKIKSILDCEPHLELNKNVKNFYDFNMSDINVSDYKNLGALHFKVAVGKMFAGA